MSNTSGLFDKGLYGARLALAWAWVALFSTSACGASPDKVRLQLKWHHQFQFAGYYAAQSEGYYKDERLDVEIIEGAAEKPSEKMVLEHKAEFGVDDGADLIFRRLQGAPVVALAAIFQHSPHVIISKQSTGVRHPADLVGRKVLITQDEGSAQILAMFRREGVKVNSLYDEKPVRFAPHSWNVEDLIEKRADAMTAYVTEIPRFKRQYGFEPAILNPLDYGVDFYSDTLFTSSEFLKAEPEVVERFRRASLKGWQFAMANPGVIADLILALPSTRQNKPDRQALLDEAQAMDNIVLPKLVEMGNMNYGRWEKMAKTYQELGMVNSVSNLDGFSYEIDAQKRVIQRQVQVLGAVALCVALLAAGSLVWLRVLRSQVRVRTLELTNQVSERKQAEEKARESAQALLASEARHAAMVANISDVIGIMDVDGLMTYKSPNIEKYFGWKPSDLVGTYGWLTVHPDDLTGMQQAFYTLLKEDNSSTTVVYRYLCKDGSYRPIELTATNLTKNPSVCGVFLNYRDITERKQAEEGLKKSEDRLRSVFNAMSEGFSIQEVICDAAGKPIDLRFIEANPAFESQTGMKNVDSLGHTLRELFPQAESYWIERYGHVALTGEPASFDAEFGPLNKHYQVSAFQTEPGRFGVTFMDISELKRADTALRDSEARNRAINQSAYDAIITSDSVGHIVGWNLGAQRIFGYTESEAMNQPVTQLIPERYRAQHLAGMDRIGSGAEAHVIGKTVELPGLHQDGSEFLLELSLAKWETTEGWFATAIVRDITERKNAEREIVRLAFSDPLTGLPNRRLLMDRLRQALAVSARHQSQGALLMVDLDNFKDVNDVLGHEQGDLVLQQIAQRLGSCIREGDTVARLGADEFVVLLAQLDQNPLEAAMEAEVVGNKVLDALKQPYQLNGSEMPCTASIGVTLFGAQHEDTVEPLKRAELAMFQAKDRGRNTLRFFDPKMQAVVASRVAMEASLRDAVAKDQLVLHYQPQVAGQGQVTGVEALLRWRDPKRGMVSPAEFIPMAEETGLILPIGNWVLQNACKQLTQWASQPRMAHLTMALNVSARQFHQRDFVDQVLMTLDRTGANPHRLKLELTESVLVEDVEGVISKMTALKGRGVTFSLDDFGTGYSSLLYLQRMPLGQLKIDQGFVRDILINPNDAAIAKMIIALAASLGLTVIPEGVETDAQRDFLAGLGCNNFQGYLFSRPLPVQEFEAFARGR